MRHTHAIAPAATRSEARLCAICGIPVDCQYFDESTVTEAPELGRQLSLARFELPPQYCGVLQYFAQFTDAYGKDPSRVSTPGLQWLILVNKRPLYPYTMLEQIVNPWGNGSFQVAIRLDENATVDFQVRRLSNAAPEITTVGGRIVGRYWYNTIYGDAV